MKDWVSGKLRIFKVTLVERGAFDDANTSAFSVSSQPLSLAETFNNEDSMC